MNIGILQTKTYPALSALAWASAVQRARLDAAEVELNAASGACAASAVSAFGGGEGFVPLHLEKRPSLQGVSLFCLWVINLFLIAPVQHALCFQPRKGK